MNTFRFLSFSILLAVFLPISATAQTGFWNDFSSSDVSAWTPTAVGAFKPNIVNTQLELQTSTSNFANLEYKFSSVDISANPKLRIKIKAPSNFSIRIDLRDASGKFTSVQPVIQAVVQSNNLTRYVLDYTGKFTSSGVDPKKIVQMSIFVNPGSSYTGTIVFDDLVLGDSIKMEVATPGAVITNQVGYERIGTKTAILQNTLDYTDTASFILTNSAGQTVFKNKLGNSQQVVGWKNRFFRVADFSAFKQNGKFRLKIGNKSSVEFEIGDNLLFNKTAFSVVDFFKGMRSTDTRDSNLPFFGTGKTNANVYGGWIDASGDPGKHMSHLSYANYFNPQQIPFVAWSLLKSYELSKTQFTAKETALLDEAAWGADYLVRNTDADGYLYIAIFDDWGNSPNRQICEWGQPGFDSGRSANYQAAMREGAGIAIAALARAYKMNLSKGTFTPANYLTTAEKLYGHLKSVGTGYKTKNLQYCNDHKENTIDWYCGLLAATELYKATKKPIYLTDAQNYLDQLAKVQNTNGWLASDSAKNRPLYHASDEGLPVIAAIELSTIDPTSTNKVNDMLSKWMKWYTSITNEVANPFNYVREYSKAYSSTSGLQAANKSFFLPHSNETGYWWQGENARLASMTSAFVLAKRHLNKNYNIGTDSVSALALAQLDWILGKNPFGVSMMEGFGTNTSPIYNGKPNIIGGICNGITSNIATETDIAWMPYDNSPLSGIAWQNWRWVEQWLPHDAWWLIAVSSISNNLNSTYTDCNNVVGGEAAIDSCKKCTGGNTGIIPVIDSKKCNPSGIDEASEIHFNHTLFPNPCKTQFTITTNYAGSFNLKIISLDGRVMYQAENEQNGAQVDVSSFQNGFYSTILDYGNRSKFVKFAVAR